MGDLEISERRALQVLTQATAELTGAAEAAVVAVLEDEVVVVAVAGTEPLRCVGEHLRAGDDTLAFVVACGQSLSVIPPPVRDPAAGATSGRASMCLPCYGEEGVVGGLELRGHAGAGPFTPHAVRAAALLVDVVTAELEDAARTGSMRTMAPSPRQLGAELVELAAADTARYGAVAWALEALLANG